MTKQISKKLSAKTVIGDVKDIRKIAESGEGKPVDLMRVIGYASKIQTGESDNGPWTAFKGSFEFTNLRTGEEFFGSRAFFPAPIDSMLEAQLEEGENVEFAFDITVTEDPSSAVGYEYGAKTVFQPSESDPMQSLKNRIQNENPLKLEKKGDKKEEKKSA